MLILLAYKNPKTEDPKCRHSGLGITASNIAEVLNDNRVPCIAVPVANGEGLWAQLARRRDVTHVVICAPFFDTAFLEKICRAFPHVRFTVTFHSNWGFLQQDIWAVRCLKLMLGLQQRVRNFQLSGNCLEFCKSTAIAFRSDVALLPNLYFLHGQVERARRPWTEGDLHLGIFGATRVLKNVLTGVTASFILGRETGAQRTYVHISTGRVEHGDGVLGTIREMFVGERHFELIEEPWQAWPDFQFTARHMDLMLQPSYTESFNNVTADAITQGVPIVVGHAINWVPRSWNADPDDAVEIASVGRKLLADPCRVAREGCDALMEHNRASLAAWLDWTGR